MLDGEIDQETVECGMGCVGAPEWYSPQLSTSPTQDTQTITNIYATGPQTLPRDALHFL